MFEVLRNPRYRTLAIVMGFVAIICVGAGTWQLFREKDKHRANAQIRANVHLATAELPELAADPHLDLRLRPVSLTGSYDKAGQVLVRQRTVDGDNVDLVLTPLRLSTGADALVVRGYVSATGATAPSIPDPPAGTVHLTGRTKNGEKAAERFDNGTVRSINPGAAGARLGTSVLRAYVELFAGQPGTDGLRVMPDPDLGNPAGGAVEPQHIAYVIQWYVFAAFALSAPFIMARAERGTPRPSEIDEQRGGADVPDAEVRRRAKLDDRYGGRGRA